MTEEVKLEVQCASCGGSGLYVGLAEQDGSAVVCSSCDGSGKAELKYTLFTGRKDRKDIKRVYQTNPGIFIEEDPTRDLKLENFGGVPFEEWKEKGKEVFQLGTEMRAFTCPAWWYQSVAYGLRPEWEECIKMGSFRNCSSFCRKSECWERFDRVVGDIVADGKSVREVLFKAGEVKRSNHVSHSR